MLMWSVAEASSKSKVIDDGPLVSDEEMPRNLRAFYGHPLVKGFDKHKSDDCEMPGDISAFYGHPLANGKERWSTKV